MAIILQRSINELDVRECLYNSSQACQVYAVAIRDDHSGRRLALKTYVKSQLSTIQRLVHTSSISQCMRSECISSGVEGAN